MLYASVTHSHVYSPDSISKLVCQGNISKIRLSARATYGEQRI